MCKSRTVNLKMHLLKKLLALPPDLKPKRSREPGFASLLSVTAALQEAAEQVQERSSLALRLCTKSEQAVVVCHRRKPRHRVKQELSSSTESNRVILLRALCLTSPKHRF